MSPKKKKTSVKISPLGGHFFDIKPPKTGKKPPVSRTKKGFFRFLWVAVAIFLIINLVNIYVRGRNIAYENKDVAMDGYEYLNKAIGSLTDQNYSDADLWFSNAEIKFKELSENTSYLTISSGFADESLYLDTAKKLIESGISVSVVGRKLVELQKEVSLIPEIFVNGYKEDPENQPELTAMIREQKEKFSEISDEMIRIQNNITTLNSDILPSDFQKKINEGQEQIAEILVLIREVKLNFDVILKMLGDDVPHTYLILFQNNHELRATGGFIGSYMIIDVNDGLITKMEAKDVYERDGQLTEFVESPPGIDKVSERLFMRDANYSPDFPTSAERIMWFLEHSQGPSADTVIAIDQTLVEGILELTGPIILEHFPFQVRADNFNKIISYHIESKISETSTPKQLLFDFIPVFKDKMLSMDNLKGFIELLQEKAGSRQIQAYSKDEDIQTLIEKLGVDGKTISPEEKTDYLSVVSSNIGGNKSDEYMETGIEHHTDILRSGLITDELSVTKTHTWEESDFDDWGTLIERYGTGEESIETVRFILGEGRNLDYMRIYVPEGSQVSEVEGLEIEDISVYEEDGYTVFAFEFGEIEAGNSKTVNIKYELPFTLSFFPSDNYRFIAQKQAGAENQTFRKTLEADEYLEIVKSFPSSTSWFSLSPVVETDFNKNLIFVSAIKKEF